MSEPDDPLTSVPAVHVARSAVLRVAGWPLSTLEAFACPRLAAAARAGRSDFRRDYDAALVGQRRLLAELTTAADFDRALTLANPVAAGRWRRRGGRVGSVKARDRRLEATVMRFVCRAAGRPTPQGGWAGVAAVTDDGCGGDGTVRVEPDRGHWWVSPAREPFAQLCRWLGHTDGYLVEGRFTLDATLHRRDGRWLVLGGGGWRILPQHPFVDRLVAWFESREVDGGLRLGPFVRATADNPTTEPMLWQALAGLRTVGALRPVLRLPVGGRTADVLGAVVDELPAGARGPWAAAVAELDRLGDGLGRALDTLDGEQLAARLDAAGAVVAGLRRALGAPGPPIGDGPALRVDRGAPFRARWGASARATVAAALTELVDVWAADGTAERYRRRHVDALGDGPLLDELWRWTASMAGTGAPTGDPSPDGGPHRPDAPDPPDAPDRPVTRAAVFRGHFGTDEVLEVEQRWACVPVSGDGPVVVGPDDLAGPWSRAPGAIPQCGAHLVVVEGDRVHLEWGRPQPALFAARHHQLPAAVDIVGELTAALAAAGLDVVDVLSRDLLAVDAAARPPGWAVLDLADRATVARLRVRRDGEDGPTTIELGRRRLFATAHSAVGSARIDPLSVLGTELVNANGWELLSFGLPLLPAERDGGPLPAVVTGSGHVLRRRRVVVDAVRAEALAVLDPAERYAGWVELVADGRLPELVSAQVGLQPPLLVPASSPLAVEALFGSLPRPSPELVLAEPPPGGCVVDGAGRRYAAELAVSWWRS